MKWVLVLIILCKFSAAKKLLGEFVPTCRVNDPNLNDCVVKSSNAFIPILSKGVKELNFPPLDPLNIPEMNIEQSNAPISLKIKLLNTVHTGLSSLRFHAASMDLENNHWTLNGTLPTYSLYGKYKGGGRLFLVPILDEGDANFTYSNTKVDFVMDGRVNSHSGQNIFNLYNLKVLFTFDKSFISLTNLLGGNTKLSEAVNQFIRGNSKEVMNGLKGSLEKVYSALYFNLIKKLLTNIPYSQVFKTT